MIFHSLETIFNHLDDESSVDIPLVPKCKCTGKGGTSYKSYKL